MTSGCGAVRYLPHAAKRRLSHRVDIVPPLVNQASPSSSTSLQHTPAHSSKSFSDLFASDDCLLFVKEPSGSWLGSSQARYKEIRSDLLHNTLLHCNIYTLPYIEPDQPECKRQQLRRHSQERTSNGKAGDARRRLHLCGDHGWKGLSELKW